MTRAAGKLLVISGPSGTGKTSICNELLRRIPDAQWSVSCTTRPPRGDERDGQHYHFISSARFDELLAAGAFLEHAEYLGHRYGTLLAPVEQAIREGRVILLEIDVQGAAQVARRMPDSVRVFVLPPTRDTLRDRLERRNTETETLQQKRLAQADREIAQARSSGDYTYFITNDTLTDSVQRILDVLEPQVRQA